MVARHPEWGGALAGYFSARLDAAAQDEEEDIRQARRIARFADHPATQELVASALSPARPGAGRAKALRAMAAASVESSPRLKVLPAAWVDALIRELPGGDPGLVALAVAAARSLPAPEHRAPALQAALLAAARDTAHPISLRLDALAAVDGGLAAVDHDLFALLRTSVDPQRPTPIRLAAAGILERATLSPGQLLTLTRAVESAGPLELPRLLGAFARSHDEALGLELMASLERARARSALRPEIVRPRLANYPEAVQRRGNALLASLHADTAGQTARLDALLATVAGGDVRRGQAVFNGPTAACISCHTIGYVGGTLGPDLTRIGEVRTERDLLEALVYPNASFARGYEPLTVTTTAGEVHSGLLRSESPEEIVLVTGDRDERRISRRAVAEMEPGSVSLMPEGLVDQLTRQELADLLAFLKATRRGAN
jgi:putative heme-binding domain-containing protein